MMGGLSQMSKQYAAKHALAYFKSHPPPDSTVTPAGASSRKALSPHEGSRGPSDSSASLDSVPSGVPQGAVITSPSPSPSSSTSDIAKGGSLLGPRDEQMGGQTNFYSGERLPPVTERVTKLASKLSYGPVTYEVGPDPKAPGCYAGKPVFKNGGRIPPDLGHVEGALSKTLAKELIAEDVLKFLNSVLEQRQAILRTYIPPNKDE